MPETAFRKGQWVEDLTTRQIGRVEEPRMSSGMVRVRIFAYPGKPVESVTRWPSEIRPTDPPPPPPPVQMPEKIDCWRAPWWRRLLGLGHPRPGQWVVDGRGRLAVIEEIVSVRIREPGNGNLPGPVSVRPLVTLRPATRDEISRAKRRATAEDSR